MPFTGSDIIKIIFAIILPPVGVFLERGCNADFLINILLTILGYVALSSSTVIPDGRLTCCAQLHPRHHSRPVHHIEVLAASHSIKGSE
jgi:uncharacterized membrane protein YqaE (UPF0057 family)